MQRPSATKSASFKQCERSKRQAEILALLQKRCNGLTRREISKELNLEINRITSPILALLKTKVIFEHGERFDHETNRNAAVLYVSPDDGVGL